MSTAINANPTVVDTSLLPTRLIDNPTKLFYRNNEFLTNLAQLSLGQVPSNNGDSSLTSSDSDDDEPEETDEQEVYDLISSIADPEHPLTLAQLSVVNLEDIHITPGTITEVLIKITPTITHCSLATLIGLGIRVRLERCLPPRYRIRILIKEGTHQSENQVNKQLNDKERVAAACENDQLSGVISQMLSTCK